MNFLKIWSPMVVVGMLISAPRSDAQQDVLVEIYNDWRGAMIGKNYARWVATTASFRQAEVRNVIVSQGGEFPAALFAIPISPPDLRDLKLLEMKTAGLTANLIYFGPVDMGFAEGRVPDNILILSFVLERANGWRFDKTRMVNLAGIPEVRADLKEGRLDFLKSPELQPRGRVPEVPPISPKPEYFGRIDVAANGYEVHMRFNGFKYAPMANTGRRNVVIGGFKEGENKLELDIRRIDIPEGEERILEMAVFASRKPQSDEVTEVFRWSPGEEVPDRFENPIWVTKDKVLR